MSSEEDQLSNKREVDWLCVVFNLQFFASCICALYFIVYDAYLTTTAFSLLLILLGILGTTAGSHRLWAHHSYKATPSLRVFLMLCQTLNGHSSIYDWVRLHRLHHKYFKTPLDPYNPTGGFIQSHFALRMLKLSPAQEKLLSEIDMSDLENDKIVMFQKKYYWILFAIITLLLPINAPVEYWDDSIMNSVFILGWLRLYICYHFSVLVHSATTIWDYNIKDRTSLDSNIVFLINKSHWLSYHYLLPWDYQTSEFGKYGSDCTSKFIRVCAALEYATDLKTTNNQLVRDALTKSIEEKKPVAECITELAATFSNEAASELHLRPSKFY